MESSYIPSLIICEENKDEAEVEISQRQINELFCRYEDYLRHKRTIQIRQELYLFAFFIIIFIVIILLGTIGYVYLFGLTWIDAFYSATVNLTAISIEVHPQTVGQKLFIIFYSLIAVIFLLSVANSLSNRIFSFLEKMNL